MKYSQFTNFDIDEKYNVWYLAKYKKQWGYTKRSNMEHNLKFYKEKN